MNGNEHLWRQFEKLGEMMGDGLHHEADGKWISVEYKKLAKILCPEGFAEIRKQKSEALNKAIQKKGSLAKNRRTICADFGSSIHAKQCRFIRRIS